MSAPMTEHEIASRRYFAGICQRPETDWEVVRTPEVGTFYDFADAESRTHGQCWQDTFGNWKQAPLGARPVILARSATRRPMSDHTTVLRALAEAARLSWSLDPEPGDRLREFVADGVQSLDSLRAQLAAATKHAEEAERDHLPSAADVDALLHFVAVDLTDTSGQRRMRECDEERLREVIGRVEAAERAARETRKVTLRWAAEGLCYHCRHGEPRTYVDGCGWRHGAESCRADALYRRDGACIRETCPVDCEDGHDFGDRAAPPPGEVPASATPACRVCNDTHTMQLEGRGDVPCTFCPRPCQKCRVGGVGAYCAQTPCACACHRGGESSDGGGGEA